MPRPRIPDDEKLVTHTVRLTPAQSAKLAAQVTSDGLPVQDHWRRALDMYLAHLAWANSPKAAPESTTNPTNE